MSNSAVIYARVSTAAGAGGLAKQIELCRACCDTAGYEVKGTFVDSGESARNMERPGLRQMLDFCRQQEGGVGTVVTYDVFRLVRSYRDDEVLKDALRKSGVQKVTTVTKGEK